MKPTLYALLVGIDEYQENVNVIPGCRFKPLNACVSDARSMKKYLKQDPTVNANVKLLTNEEATKENIAEAFKTHLARATATDRVLFYFSGHGIAEFADPSLWESEADGRLECLVCYNDGKPCLMADKELRFLLKYIDHYDYAGNEKVKPDHIVTIFDNCHSGDNTREAVVQSGDEQAQARQLGCVAPRRDWKDFIFSDEIEQSFAASQATANVLPAISHVHMSACEAHEVAWEARGKGVFTKNLIEQLERSGGRISYYDLISKVRLLIGNSRYRQTPVLYAPDEIKDSRSLQFLGNDDNTPRFTQLVYDKHNGWTLMAGLFHGVSLSNERIDVTIADNQKVQLSLKEVHLDRSIVKVPADVYLDKEEIYNVIASGLFLYSGLKINIENHDYSAEEFEEFVNVLQQSTAVEIVTEEADYVLNIRFGQLYISNVGDPFRPVVRPIEMSAAESNASEISSMLKQLAETRFLKNLQHGESGSAIDPLRIEAKLLNSEGNLETADIKNGLLGVNFHNVDGEWKSALQLTFTNKTTQTLYVSTLYYAADFQLYDGLVDPKVAVLEPGNSITLWQHQENPALQSRIPMSAQDYMMEYNWLFLQERLQFIVSLNRFELPDISREGLPTPLTTSEIEKGDSRGSFDVAKEKEADMLMNGWHIQTVDLRLFNPQHNTISAEKLYTLLRHELTAGFAAGLYLQREDGLSDKYKLHPDIKVVEGEEGTRSALFDFAVGMANMGARAARNWKFRKQMRRYPDRLLVLSEGDSWFQHPLVKDVIDHLGGFYNIYSVGAAGDEFRNYLMAPEFKDKLTALEAEYKRPVDIFLISGGGNDILGSQFVDFIKAFDEVEKLPERERPERFFTDRYHNELKSLMEFYDTLLAHFAKHHPDLTIVTHGYDYVRPLPPNAEKMSWLGKPMDLRGISRNGDRQGLINYMIDSFNDMLISITERHDNAIHIDVRGRVHEYQWYDEIHPDKEGFQEVALQYVRQIDKLDYKLTDSN